MPEPRRYLKLSDASWELARAAYLSGLSAPVVAARFGVSVAALRKRATRQGWTKAAFAALQAAPSSPTVPDEAGLSAPAADLSPAVLARTALQSAARAVVAGRPREARQHADAGLSMARLSSQFPELGEAVSVHERDWGQSQIRMAMQEQALLLARLMAQGRPLPPSYAQIEALWARQGGPPDAA